MPLTPQEQSELNLIESELMSRGGQSRAPTGGLTPQEQAELLQIENELTSRQAAPKIDTDTEASLGFVNRARFAIEPLQSNRIALLQQEYGQENVMQDAQGNPFVNINGTFQPANVEGFSAADVADFAGAIPEGVGSLIGGAAGFVGGGGVGSIPAAIGLGAAGGAVGSIARQGLSAALGTPQVATPIERVTETGLSGAFGAAGAGVGAGIKTASPAVKSAIKRLGKGFVDILPGGKSATEILETSYRATNSVVDSLRKRFNPRIAEDAAEFFAIAEKNGIDKTLLPEAVEFGRESVISRNARHIAEGPFGEDKLKSFYKAQGQITNAIEGSMTKISPEKFANGIEAGNHLIDAVNGASKRFFSSLDETYNSLVKNAPGLQISEASSKRIASKLNGLEKFAKGRVQRGIGSQKSEAKSILEAVNSIRSGNNSLKQTVESLKNIGEEAFKKGTQNRTPIDQKRLRTLYFDMQKEVIETIRENYGDESADSLIRNNKMINDFLGESSVISKTIDRVNADPEGIFKSLVANGSSTKIEALKAIVPAGDLAPLKTAALDSVIVRNADGLVMYESTIKKMMARRDMLSALFEPEELGDLRDLLRLGRRTGDPVLSSSGTGASNAFAKIKDDIINTVSGETQLNVLKARARNFKPKPPKVARPPSRPSAGRLSNLFGDTAQRDAAFFTRGPSAMTERESEKSKRKPSNK